MKMRLVLAALVAAACGKGNTGTVRASLTDAPAPANVQKVLVTINEVRIHDDGDEMENDNEPADDKPGPGGEAKHPEADKDGVRGKGWIVLCTGTQTFDLLTLTNGRVAALCPSPSEVPVGKIDEIWLGVTALKIVYTDGTSVDIAVPRGPGNGLKLDLDDAPLTPHGTIEIKVDFDAGLSLIVDSSSHVVGLSPKLRELH
jgi:hypothetical protein